jgi:hypothetical protein
MSPEPGYAYGICDKPGLLLLEQASGASPQLKFIGHSKPSGWKFRQMPKSW